MERPPCCTLPPDDAPIEAAGYAAYNAGGDPATAGLTFTGAPCPTFDGLTDNVRAKWKAGRQEMARRIITKVLARVSVDDLDARDILAEFTED